VVSAHAYVQPNSNLVSSYLLRLHWLIPKMLAATSATNPSTDPTAAPAIEASPEDCWSGSVGEDVDDVNNDSACVVAGPARVILDVEIDR